MLSPATTCGLYAGNRYKRQRYSSRQTARHREHDGRPRAERSEEQIRRASEELSDAAEIVKRRSVFAAVMLPLFVNDT